MPSFSVSYTYDGAGNRLTETDNLLGQTTNYAYDAANRLLTIDAPVGVTTFTYDPSGNRTRKETPAAVTDYTYDPKNRLIKIEPVSGDVELTYNAAGVRVRKETPGEVKKFIYDLENLLQETDADGLTERAYTQTTEEYGDLISQHADDETSYPEFDAQWSTAVLLDENESVTDRYRYRAFGVEDHEAGMSSQPLTFAGKRGYYRDEEVDLYFVRARYYDPEAGRWLTKDPLGLDAGDNNLYRYVENNPVNKVDPSGKIQEVLTTTFTTDYWFSQNVTFNESIGLGAVGEHRKSVEWSWQPNCDGDSPKSVGVIPWYSSSSFGNQKVERLIKLTTGDWVRPIVEGSVIGEAFQAPSANLAWPTPDTSDRLFKIDQFFLKQAKIEGTSSRINDQPILSQVLYYLGNLPDGVFNGLGELACGALKAFAGTDVCSDVKKLFTCCGDALQTIFSKGSLEMGSALYAGGETLLTSLKDGATQVFTGFQDNVGKYLADGFFKWLKLPPGVTQAFTDIVGTLADLVKPFITADNSSVAEAPKGQGDKWLNILKSVLQFFDLTKSTIFSVLVKAAKTAGVSHAFRLLMPIYGVMDKLISSGSPAKAVEWIEKLFQGNDSAQADTSAQSLPEQIGGELFSELGGFLIGEILSKVMEIISSFTPAAVIQLLRTAANFIGLVAQGCQGLTSLITDFGTVIKKAADGAAGEVVNFLNKAIVTGIRFGVEFLARIAHLATFPEKFGTLRTKVSSTIEDKAADFLAFVLKPVGNLFDKFQPTESVQANDLLLPPAEAQSPSGKTVRVYVKNDGIAYVSASPEKKLTTFAKEIGDPALTAASQELQTNATSVKSQKPAFEAALTKPSPAAGANSSGTTSPGPSIDPQPYINATEKERAVAEVAAKLLCDQSVASTNSRPLHRVAETGKPAFQLQKGEEGLSVFDGRFVSVNDVLPHFRSGSFVITKDAAIFEKLCLSVVKTSGNPNLPKILQKNHWEIQRGEGMDRNQFKKILKTL